MDISFLRFVKILIFTFSYFLCTIAEVNNYGLCGNPECSVPIGEGLTMNRYLSIENNKISFEPNEKFVIFVKQAGPRKDLLGVEIRNQKAYIPLNLVREEKTFVSAKYLVPAHIDFVFQHVHTNNVDSQFQSSSQWSQQDGQSFSHTDGGFQSGKQDASQSHHQGSQSFSHTDGTFQSSEQDMSQWSHQNVQPQMSHIESSFQGHSSSQWPNQDVQFIMPSESNFQQEGQNIHSGGQNIHSGEQNIHSGERSYYSDYDYHYSGNIGPSHSPQYYASHYYSSDERHSHFDYVHGNPNLEPSVHVHVQSNILVPPLHKTNVEHFVGSQYPNVPNQIHQPSVSEHAHQGSQGNNIPLESSFTSQWQGNSLNAHYSQNPQSSKEHVSNFELQSTIPSQRSEFQSDFNSQMNSKYSLGDSNQFTSTPSNTFQNDHNQHVMDTIAALKKQGYDFMDPLLDDQILQNDLNPSQHAQFSQPSAGADYGYSSSLFENTNEQVSELRPSQEDIIPSLPTTTNVDKTMTETSEHMDQSDALSTSENAATSVVEDIMELGLEEDGDNEGDEIVVEEEDDEVENLIPSDDGEMENDDMGTQSDSKILQKEKVTSTQSDSEATKLHAHNVDSVLQPEVQSTLVQEPGFTSNSYSSIDSNLHNPDIVSSTDKITSDQTEIVSENVSTNSDLNKVEENKLEDNIVDGSNSGATSSIQPDSISVSKTLDYSETSKFTQVPNHTMSENADINNENLVEMLPDVDQYKKTESDMLESGVFSFDKTDETLGIENVNETDNLSDREQETELDKILNISELSESEKVGYFNPYQIRNLKEENGAQDNQNIESDEESEENITYVAYDFYGTFENGLEVIRSFIELLLSWVPEPLYSIIMDVQKSGISPRVPVFTIISSIPCISLIIAIVYIKEKSKEKKLTTLLALSEKNVYMLTAEKNILEEKIEKTAEELKSSSSTLDSERSTFESLKSEVENLKQQIQKTSEELESSIEEIDTLKDREKEYAELVSDHEKAHLELREEKKEVEIKVLELEEAMSSLNSEIIEKDSELDELQKEKLEFLQSSKDYEEKLSLLQQNCNQLLKEAEVWNIRVNELTSKLSEMSSEKNELEESLKSKDSEIESLTHLVTTLKSYENLELTDGDEIKSNEEKLKDLLNSTNILIKLNNQEEENKALVEKLSGEKNKILEMEVELLDTKSECDKLKVSYNQALQDKAEAQTKLDVLTNYFKDKEIQMQKQIGAQEAVREKREKDADSAERRICLIEQENNSYKYQVASMKQEMEETERNLKSQIATQEKKAHENWIAARAAERKLEDMKQEVTQLRQRLTLLEREQENWANSTRDEIIRPVPKRISGINDESATSQDLNNSMDIRHNMFPPPPPPPPHLMMLPLDRPLPPLPPPHHLPPFIPPPPQLEPQFRMQPWHPGSDYRITPPDFGRGRESTPPRGHHSANLDGDMGPRQSSPLGGEMRDSRNSTPPHSLPDFHDIPPPPRPFFPPPGAHPRYPMPPPFRRDLNQGSRKTDIPSDHSSSGHGTQQSSGLQDNWPHSNSRV